MRVCISRTGIVMGRGGGALAGLAPMFRMGVGAVAGRGDQWVSWVHMEDLLCMFEDFMADDALAGPFNNTAPNPVTNRDFSRAIGRVLHRPVLLKAPAFAMRLAYGELAHRGEFFRLTQHGGWQLELQGMFLATAVALVLLGPGRFAVNRR